jgi:hypothetical protein
MPYDPCVPPAELTIERPGHCDIVVAKFYGPQRTLHREVQDLQDVIAKYGLPATQKGNKLSEGTWLRSCKFLVNSLQYLGFYGHQTRTTPNIPAVTWEFLAFTSAVLCTPGMGMPILPSRWSLACSSPVSQLVNRTSHSRHENPVVEKHVVP